jgi:hypothetical protein
MDLAVLADNRDGEAVAVRRKAEAPHRMESGGGSQRGELLLDAGYEALAAMLDNIGVSATKAWARHRQMQDSGNPMLQLFVS